MVSARLGGGQPQRWSEIPLLLAGALVVALAYLRLRSIHRRIEARAELHDETTVADALLLGLVAALFALLAAFALHVT